MQVRILSGRPIIIMPRFADSKEIVANEDVEPIDEQFQKSKIPTLSSKEEHHFDTVGTVEHYH